MKRDAIANALKARLNDAALSAPEQWPNLWDDDDLPPKPYLVVSFGGQGRNNLDVAGAPVETGLMNVTVVVEPGGGETAANTFANQISDEFPAALRVTTDDALVQITRPADIQSGFRDGADWRLPVLIYYRAVPI